MTLSASVAAVEAAGDRLALAATEIESLMTSDTAGDGASTAFVASVGLSAVAAIEDEFGARAVFGEIVTGSAVVAQFESATTSETLDARVTLSDVVAMFDAAGATAGKPDVSEPRAIGLDGGGSLK